MADKKLKRSIASVQAYKSVFGSEDGQKVLWDLMKLNGMLADNFVQGDSHATAYNEGRRAVVLYIIEKINLDTKLLAKKYQEGLNNENRITQLS